MSADVAMTRCKSTGYATRKPAASFRVLFFLSRWKFLGNAPTSLWLLFLFPSFFSKTDEKEPDRCLARTRWIILSHVRRGFNPALVQPHLAPNNICLITVSWSFFACPLEH
jgi:hypothetical protein